MDKRRSILKRFNEKWQENEDGCWIWTAGKFSEGYAKFWYQDESCGGHRVSYKLFRGEIEADGVETPQVNHKCHVKECVNPAHLYVGDQQANIQDAIEQTDYSPSKAARGEDRKDVKLSNEEVREIRKRYESSNISQSDLANEYDVTQPHICKIVNYEKREHIR